MQILIVKLSSMGDIFHTLPAITDLKLAMPDATIDWVIDENFACIGRWHPAINQVIPVPLREIKKNPFKLLLSKNLRTFLKRLRHQRYDHIIDPQGLMFKSTLISLVAKGKVRHGYSYHSARDRFTSIFCNNSYVISKKIHAITRIRMLFSQALNYHFDSNRLDFGIKPLKNIEEQDYILCFHGTTWESKHWPNAYWRDLLKSLNQQNINVKLAWGNDKEKAVSLLLAKGLKHVELLAKSSIEDMQNHVQKAKAVISVDTGFAHLSQIYNKNLIVLFGPSDAQKVGPLNENSKALQCQFPCSPCFKRTCEYKKPSDVKPACFQTLPPQKVLQTLFSLLNLK